MFLIVNAPGTRSVIVDTFEQLAKLKFNGSKVIANLLAPFQTARYDLILTYIHEPVSGHIYLKGEIINNPSGLLFRDFQNIRPPKNVTSDPFYALSGLFEASLPRYVGKRYNIADFFPDDFVVNGHIPIDCEIPKTILDNWDELIPVLDTFFFVSPPVHESQHAPAGATQESDKPMET